MTNDKIKYQLKRELFYYHNLNRNQENVFSLEDLTLTTKVNDTPMAILQTKLFIELMSVLVYGQKLKFQQAFI
jgi:hypothetical protein